MTKKKKIKTIITVPSDVYDCDAYVENFTAITKGTGRLFMFAADQKIEHLNQDFYGASIADDANDPEHIFRIAQHGSVGALAVHMGLVARYGAMYNNIDYIVKLNGKTNLVDSQLCDPISRTMWDFEDIANIAMRTDLHIRGVGYTVYLGSEHEHAMISQAAQVVIQAHQVGLIAILWIYPRAKHIKDAATPELVAGAAGIGNALGADFVKVSMPHAGVDMSSMQALSVATQAAGNTGVICSGGKYRQTDELLTSIYEQITVGRASGCAIGRNIFQRSYSDAIALSKAISAIVYDNVSLLEAKKIVEEAS